MYYICVFILDCFVYTFSIGLFPVILAQVEVNLCLLGVVVDTQTLAIIYVDLTVKVLFSSK